MASFVLSIDQGTSGSKVNIFDRSGTIVAASFHEVAQYYPRQGWVEQEPEEIWITVIKAVTDAIKAARISPEEIVALGISNQRCTTVLWNKVSGDAIGRAIIWQDRRTQAICDRFSAAEVAEMEKRNGVGLFPNCSSTKIRWLMEEDGMVQKAFARGELLFGTIDSWLIWKLTGGGVHITDHSNASATGLLNAATMDYDDWILGKFGIPREILPELRSSCEVYAHTHPDAFLGASVPISGCAGDQPAAAFGQACFKPGMVKNTYGTGSFMILCTGNKRFRPTGGIIAPSLWTIAGETTHGIEGFADVSGEVMRWLRDGLGILHELSEADGLAMRVQDTGGVYFVPALVGLGSMHRSPDARGTIFGINLGTSKHHITRAALESMAYQTRDAFERVSNAFGAKPDSLRVDGGGAQSDFLMQFQSDILGIPVERPAVIETSAQGAAYLAGLAVGFWKSIDEIATNWQLETRFEPRISTSRRDDLYAGWLRAIEYAEAWGNNSSSPVARKVIEERLDRLSPRELEVVRQFAGGKPMREIAASLCTSVKTVEKQRHDAMVKLGVDNLMGLMKCCVDLGLVT